MTSKYSQPSDSVVSVQTKQKSDSLKVILLASLAGCITLGMQNVQAAELADVDMSKKPNDLPTLDYLNQNNVTIPSEDGLSSTILPPSSYTLMKVDDGGENTITKFEWDENAKSFNPVYYKLDLKKNVYGEGNTSKTFTLNAEPVKDVEITVKYDDLSGKTYDKEYKKANYTGRVTAGGSSTAPSQIIRASFQNTDSTSISIDNAIFENNSVVISFSNPTYAGKTAFLNVLGSTLYNTGTIDKITADFVNNSVTVNRDRTSAFGSGYGGAIYNKNEIGNVVGNFVGNFVSAGAYAYGGAIYNAANASLGDITGDFIENKASSSTTSSTSTASGYGGAISNNEAQIGNITGNFIGNCAYSNQVSAYGGAIHNVSNSIIGDIKGDFIGNHASARSAVNGGAIYNHTSTIGDITGDFIGNYILTSTSSEANGGAVYNYGTIGNVVGNFIGNYADSYSAASGGALYNLKKVGDITGDFIGN